MAGGKERLRRSLRCWTVAVGEMRRVVDSPVRARIWISLWLFSAIAATTWETVPPSFYSFSFSWEGKTFVVVIV